MYFIDFFSIGILAGCKIFEEVLRRVDPQVFKILDNMKKAQFYKYDNRLVFKCKENTLTIV